MAENKKIKITYILFNIDRAVAFEWIAEELDKNRFELSFILLNEHDSYLEDYLIRNKIPVKKILYHGKKDIVKAIALIYLFLRKNKTEIVHCHLFEASLCGIIAARLAGIKKRIYTRHHSVQHHTYFPQAVKYDLFINKLSTHIIAISKNVMDTLVEIEKVAPTKITLIHHGFKLELFDRSLIDQSRIQTLKTRYKIRDDAPVIGVISRFLHLKGVEYIIPAFKKLLEEQPNAILVLANTEGSYKNVIEALLLTLPEESYRTIKFEHDFFALYHLFNVFVHVPIDEKSEAFGQIYVEALAAGIPSVFTNSGIATEFIIDKKNALVVPFQNSESVYDAMKKILESPLNYQSMIVQGKKDVQDLFSIHLMVDKLNKLYES